VALIIAFRVVGDVTVLDLSGKITLGEGSVQLRDAIRGLISKGVRNILLNLEQVNHIDSSGLGELVSAYTAARNQHGEVKLLNPAKKIYELLQLTKLSTVFDIRDDQVSAIASFNR
jgi:anti-sigma B factor antagonist